MCNEISMDKKYKTRDGREVEIITTTAKGEHPVIVNIKCKNSEWIIGAYDFDGRVYLHEDCDEDLVEDNKKKFYLHTNKDHTKYYFFNNPYDNPYFTFIKEVEVDVSPK